MARDERWPFALLIIMRSIQLLFGILILGMTSYIASLTTLYWFPGMSVFISLVVVLWTIINFVLYFLGLLLPIAVVVIDAFCVFFLFISMIGATLPGFLASSCTTVIDSYTVKSTPCMVAKASFSLLLLSMLLFIATLIYASIVLHKTRKDLRGNKYNHGLPYMTDWTPDEEVEIDLHDQKLPQKPAPAYTTQPVSQGYASPQPQIYPQQTVSPLYPPYTGGGVAGFVSPPNSPPPQGDMYEMHTGMYSNAAEMSAVQQQRQPGVQDVQQQQQYRHGEFPS
ncbi:hypothetical protein K440DRAFT_683044 [Wilcoxina mikolae CBS 423.85]|nr:hypothetical protein K440DRAFT_683044 [Wilcoxina mikolae CBS 423.85]